MTGEIIRSFIIFHEAGHALDYFEHFYFPFKKDEDVAEANPQIKEKCEKENITSEEKLYQLQELAYRTLPKENYANVFAAKYFPIFLTENRGASS